MPLDRVRDCRLQGVLTLHTVNVGPGAWLDRFIPTIQKLLPSVDASNLKIVAHESAVHFEVANQKVHHEGLEFGMAGLTLRTSGYVGFDESLDMVAEIKLQLPESTVADRPVLRALNGRVMRLPVKGTLKHPEVDWGNRPELRQGLLSAIDGNALPGSGATLADGLKASGILSSPDGETSAAADLGIAAGELVKKLMERRRERKEEQAQSQQANPTQPPAPDENPGDVNPAPPEAGSSNAAPQGEGRRILGQALRAFVGAAAQAADQDQQPPAGGPATPPVPSPVAPLPSSSLPSSSEGPSLVAPANGRQPPPSVAAVNSEPEVPARSEPSNSPTGAQTAAEAAPTSSTAGSSAPPASPTQPTTSPAVVPPPPLLQTPLPAATGQAPPMAGPTAVAPANPATVIPPADNQPPRRRIGRALRALIESAEDAPPPPALNPPVGNPPPNARAAADNPRVSGFASSAAGGHGRRDQCRLAAATVGTWPANPSTSSAGGRFTAAAASAGDIARATRQLRLRSKIRVPCHASWACRVRMTPSAHAHEAWQGTPYY